MQRVLLAVIVAVLVSVLGAFTVPRLPRLDTADGRIVGGESASIEELPYQASLRFWGTHVCGASILSATTVLTAAQCIILKVASYHSVQTGVTYLGGSSNIYAVKRITLHPQYDAATNDHDLCLLELKTSMAFGTLVQPIALATETPTAGAVAIVSGWGTTKEGGLPTNVLHRVHVTVVAPALCKAQFARANWTITEHMICAGEQSGGKDACHGDSGGPMVVAGRLTGVVSWGLGCARAEYAGVYTNVPKLRLWIEESSSGI